MGASSKASTRLVTSTIVVTLTDPEPSTLREETTEPSGSSEFSTTASSSATPSSLPIALPINFPSFTTTLSSDSKAPSSTPFLSAAPSVVTATQTVVIFPSANSAITSTTQADSQTQGLSRKNIIIISSSAGGGVLLALLAGIIFCVIRRRKRRARETKYSSSYGSPPGNPFGLSLKGANISQEKFHSAHHEYSTRGSPRYEPDHGHNLYYDGHANNVVGQLYAPALGEDRVVIAPQRSPGRGKTPLLPKSTHLESPVDPEMDERRRLNVRLMRADETPPSSASPINAGYGFGHDDGDVYSPDEYGEYAPYEYAYTSSTPLPIVRPAISLADAIPARTHVPVPPAPLPTVASSSASALKSQHSSSPPKSQQHQQHATMEASSSFEYPSWIRMGLDSGAIASVASTSAIPAVLPSSVIPANGGAKKKNALALAPLVIPEYTPRPRAATVSIPSSRDSSRSPARRPQPPTPLAAPPPEPASMVHPSPPISPAHVKSFATQASMVTRKSTKGRRSVKRGKAAYQALDPPGAGPAGVEVAKRADSPGAYSDGGDSASMYSQVSASMYSHVSASTSVHANEHNRAGLELSDSTILAFPLIMRQNPPPPLPRSGPIRGLSSPSLSPSMSLPNDVFGAGVARPRRDPRAMMDPDGDADDTMTMRVADLIQSRVRHMRGVAPPERTGSVVSHIERAGSIKPAFGLRAVDEDGVDYDNGGQGSTRPLRIGASKAAAMKVRMARMKHAAATTDTGPIRPLQDGTNIK